MDLISVIVPVYNAEKYLRQCIESILHQTYPNIELILVNDGSIDSSLEICDKYSKIDKRIKVISKENSGVSDTRNYGIEVSNGKYVSFVDSDDMIKENMLETLYKKMQDHKTDITTCNFEYDYSGNRLPKKPRLPSGHYKLLDLKNILIDDGSMSGILFGSVCLCLYKKSIIIDQNIRFALNVKYNEDGLFNLNYLRYCNSIYVLSEEYLYIYRSNENSVTNSLDLSKNKYEIANDEIKFLFKFKDFDNNKDQMHARQVSIAFWNILGICTKSNKQSIIRKIKAIREICIDIEVIEGLNYIKLDKINKYKKIYYYLIKNNQSIPIYVMSRYIYPILKKIVVR